MHLLQDALNGPVRLRADVFCEYCTNLKISRVKGYLTYFKISFPMKFLRISLDVGGKKYSDNELYSGINPEVLLHSSSLPLHSLLQSDCEAKKHYNKTKTKIR